MKKIVFAVLLVLFIASPAMAKTVIEFPPGYLQDQFKDFSTDLGLALSYIPLAPAEPLGGGVLPHIDAGVEVTAVKIDKNASYWANAVADVPGLLPFAKLHAQVGLPVIPVDLGIVYSSVPNSDIKLVGGEIKWAFMPGSTLLPAVAVRAAYTKLTGVDVLDLSTKSLDVSISKGFAMLTPYAGIGEVWITSKPKTDIPLIPLEKEDITQTKGFVGLKLSLLPVFNIVAEADFAKVNAYSLRLNLHF